MAKQMGRPTIFSPKEPGRSYQILAMTRDGRRMFERSRKELKRLAKWPGKVSDADTVEFILRGTEATVAYLKAKG